MRLIFEVSYNGTDWVKAPDDIHAVDANGIIIENMLYIPSSDIIYVRVVVEGTIT